MVHHKSRWTNDKILLTFLLSYIEDFQQAIFSVKLEEPDIDVGPMAVAHVYNGIPLEKSQAISFYFKKLLQTKCG